jgi:aspartate/glutamate racemase
MEYDFSTLCVGQLEKLRKKLDSSNKAFIKEYEMALDVINNPEQHEHRGEIIIGVEDELRDVANKCEIFYTETMNKVQRELAKFL